MHHRCKTEGHHDSGLGEVMSRLIVIRLYSSVLAVCVVFLSFCISCSPAKSLCREGGRFLSLLHQTMSTTGNFFLPRLHGCLLAFYFLPELSFTSGQMYRAHNNSQLHISAVRCNIVCLNQSLIHMKNRGQRLLFVVCCVVDACSGKHWPYVPPGGIYETEYLLCNKSV